MKQLKNLWKDESAQGMTEYILLLVVIVAVIILFKGQITEKLKSVINDLSGKMDQVTGGGN